MAEVILEELVEDLLIIGTIICEPPVVQEIITNLILNSLPVKEAIVVHQETTIGVDLYKLLHLTLLLTMISLNILSLR